jgi:hypothetical protein
MKINNGEVQMDEQFRKSKLWVGLAAAAILFLCVALCGLGAMVTMGARSSTVYLQPPAGQEGAAPPQVYHSNPGPWGLGGSAGTGLLGFIFGAVGFLFRIAFLGLILLLLFGLVRRLFWGPRHGWAHFGPRPPCGPKGWDKSHPWHGPWAWHGQGPTRETGDEPGETTEPDTETGYHGPQE